MKLSEICVRRPVFSTVLCLILIIVGILGYNSLSLRFLPDYQPNKITIMTTYDSGSADYIETNITTPIEEQISGISGVDFTQSLSIQGASMITVNLKQNANYDRVANDVRTRLELAKKLLPDDLVVPPVVQRGYREMPLLRIAFVNPQQNLQDMRDFVERNVKDQISQINGVSSIQLQGAPSYAMLIKINPTKMSSLGLSIAQLSAAIAANTEEKSAGKIQGDTMDFPVNEDTKLQTAAQYKDIVITTNNGRLVTLGDVADVELTGFDLNPSIVRVNGKPAVTMQVMSTTDGNEIEIATNIKKYLAQLRTQAPSGMKILTYSDMSTYMQESIHEVYLSILFAILCVVLVVYLFLGSFRTVLIPIMTIPICMIATFALMSWLSFTINMITLIALILSIGLVVDDAIVVLENIYRHLQGKESTSSFQAAIAGSKEITFAIVVMTLTLAAVYAPFGFIGGMAAAFLKPFAFTLAGAVVISGFVSLTLSPMMCSKLLHKNEKPGWYQRVVDSTMDNLSKLYRRILSGILKVRFLVVIATILIAFAGFSVAKTIPFESSPPEDVGFMFVTYQMTQNEDVKHTSKQLIRLENIVKKYPQVESYVTLAMSANVFAFPSVVIVVLKPLAKRKVSSATLTNEIEKEIRKLPGINAYAHDVTGGGSGMNGFEFTLSSPEGYGALHNDVSRIIKQLSLYPGVYGLKSNVNFDTQQYSISINRQLAAKLQVSVADINDVIATMIGGRKVSSFTLGGKNYYSYLIAPPALRKDISNLQYLFVKSATDKQVPLSSLVNVNQEVGQSSLPHYNRQHAATISGQLSAGYDLGKIVKHLQTVLPQIMPPGMQYAFIGAAQDVVDSNSDIGLLFLLALLFIYLVMAAQFESFLDPIVILFSVPLCIVSALFALKWFGGSLNLYTNVALITLVGLISKHGILITHFANQLHEQGKSTLDALLEAASMRLRPILMTTAATAVGALPLLFAFGAGANSRHQIGLVIVVGMIFGTFFSLIVVPVGYSLAHQCRAKFMPTKRDTSKDNDNKDK